MINQTSLKLQLFVSEQRLSRIQPTEFDKIFSNCISDKRLISRICRGLLKLNNRKTNSPTQKWTKDLNKHFCKEHIQMANTHMQRSSISRIVREIQVKTTVRYFLTPFRMVTIKKAENDKRWQGCG